MIGEHAVCTIDRIERESERIITIYCKERAKDLWRVEGRAGQFMMVWVPSVDEKPFSVVDNDPLTFTFTPVGPFTSLLAQLKPGDRLGVRGPIGRSFTHPFVKKALIVSGGVGIAPLRALERELINARKPYTFIVGARTKSFLPKTKESDVVVTDDGTAGEKALCSKKAEELLSSGEYDFLYACGPEKMLVALLSLAKNIGIDGEFCLERYMKCALGVCGQCAIGEKRVCIDGPVFSLHELRTLDEFGLIARDATGFPKKI